MSPKKIERALILAIVLGDICLYPTLFDYPVLQVCVMVSGFIVAFIGAIEFLTSDEFTSKSPNQKADDE